MQVDVKEIENKFTNKEDWLWYTRDNILNLLNKNIDYQKWNAANFFIGGGIWIEKKEWVMDINGCQIGSAPNH